MYKILIITDDSQKSNCHRERDAANARGPLPGLYVVQCEDNGDYSTVQTHASTGYSWCVDPKTGKKFDGSDTRFTAPDCSKYVKGKN